jgi:cysteine desulfurase/selenocysteine lyase
MFVLLITVKRKSFLTTAALLAAAGSRAEIRNRIAEIPAAADDEQYWSALRASLFPIENGRIFLNNGTMGITPYPVLASLQKGFEHAASKGAYPGHTEDLQKAIAELIGCDADEIAITKNVSEGINHACWGIPLSKGDEVLMTTHEHAGGCIAWLHRANLDGIVIKTFPLGKTAEETLSNLKKAVTKKTKVIAIPHIPCTIGQILPVQEICDFAKSSNIITALDGAHPLGMIRFNVHEIGCDYYSGCLHKWALAPLGLGYFYIKKSMLNKTRCTHVAAYSSNEFNMANTPPTGGTLVDNAHRFYYGTFCGPLFEAGLEALKLYKKIGPERIETRVRSLATYLQESLLALGDKIIMFTPTEAKSRGAQVAFRINNGNPKASSEFVTSLYSKKITLRYVGENNVDCIRVSTHYYNNREEIDTLVAEVKKAIG